MAVGPSVWDRVVDNLPLWIGSAVVSSIIGVVIAFVYRRLGIRNVKPTDAETPVAPVHPRAPWKDGELARTYLAKNLLSGFTVASGTRVVIIDGGVRQPVELPEGENRAAEVKRRFARHSIRPGAIVLQYTTKPAVWTVEFAGLRSADGRADLGAKVTVSAAVNPATAERVEKWDLLRDGVLVAAEIEQFVRDELAPVLRAEVARFSGNDAVGGVLRAEAARLSGDGMAAAVLRSEAARLSGNDAVGALQRNSAMAATLEKALGVRLEPYGVAATIRSVEVLTAKA